MPYLFPEGTARLLKLKVTYGIVDAGNPFSSIHYYLASNDYGNSADLATAFAPDYGAVFQAIVADDLVSIGVVCTNMGDPEDFFSVGQSITGAVGGDLLKPWDCWVFREVTGNRLAPYGFKRIGYLTEFMVGNGGNAEGDIVDELNDYAGYLSSVINTGAVNYTPVLVSPANETHGENLVLPFITSEFRGHGHAIGRKTY